VPRNKKGISTVNAAVAIHASGAHSGLLHPRPGFPAEDDESSSGLDFTVAASFAP